MLFFHPFDKENTFTLSEEESRHCIKALRYQKGDVIAITNGMGESAEAIITNDNIKACEVKITERKKVEAKRFLHVAIAPTKNADRIEWLVEKASELGVEKISLIQTERTERNFIKKERLDKIAISAIKQSHQFYVPEIVVGKKFEDILVEETDIKLIAFVDRNNPVQFKEKLLSNQKILILIGPEGDFTAEEVALAEQHHFTKVSLGNNILRTETAGLLACCAVYTING
ncbi:MAG: RsmE family RNA methyltransferase [Cyclobacteriaceae bacterium]|nr:RsmE family RNA methyltransferase [Cytophagales bacterium]MCZ8328837.1 RsmE family RNA methyltransferase [Cyclobacteriaceae bacterium]